LNNEEVKMKPRKGLGWVAAHPEAKGGVNGKAFSAKPDQNLAVVDLSTAAERNANVEKVVRLLEGMPAREEKIHARVMRQLHGTGLPTPAHIVVLLHQVGSDDQIKADCESLARRQEAPVLICDPEGKILAFSWPAS
jgi:hypothetical protein